MQSMLEENRVIASILSIICLLLMSRTPQERACVQFGMRQADGTFQSVGADTKPVETGSPSTFSQCCMTTAARRVLRYASRFDMRSIDSSNRYLTCDTGCFRRAIF